MGYNTDLYGKFELNKRLTKKDAKLLDSLHCVRPDIVKDLVGMHNPLPDSWCQWVSGDEGWCIEWDGQEKFYDYIEWINYIIEAILKPRGYVLNGKVKWVGDDGEYDTGVIIISDNVVTTKRLKMVDDDGESHGL